MKKEKVNLQIDKDLHQHLQAVASEFNVPKSLLIKRVLWQFVNNAKS